MATSVSKNSTNSRPHAVDVTSYDARGYILPFCYNGISKVLNIQKMSVHPSSHYISYVLNWIQVWAICWPWQDVDVVLSQVTRCYSSGVRASIVLFILFIYLFNTLFQEGDAISYKLFLLAALIKTTTTICTIYTKSHSHEYSNKTRNSQYVYDNYKFVVRFDFICLTSRFLNEDIVLADLTAVGNLFQI